MAKLPISPFSAISEHPHARRNNEIAEFGENAKVSDIAIFRNFRAPTRTREQRVTVTDKIAEFAENGKVADIAIFRNFRAPTRTREQL